MTPPDDGLNCCRGIRTACLIEIACGLVILATFGCPKVHAQEPSVVPERGEAGDQPGNVLYAKTASEHANGFHLGATLIDISHAPRQGVGNSAAAMPEKPSAPNGGDSGALSFSQWTLIAGSALDGVSTLYALSVNPRAKEVNPALNWGGRTSVVIGKLATTSALTWAITKLQPTHPRIAKAIGFGGGIGLSALAARNLQQAKR